MMLVSFDHNCTLQSHTQQKSDASTGAVTDKSFEKHYQQLRATFSSCPSYVSRCWTDLKRLFATSKKKHL